MTDSPAASIAFLLRHLGAVMDWMSLPNDKGQPAATEPVEQGRRGPLGCADLLDSEPLPEK